MSVDEVKMLLSYLGSLGIGILIGGGMVFLLLKSFLPAYLSEKGKNLATREDIGKITHEIEEVKSQYTRQLQEIAHQNTLLIEEIRSRHQLRLAAVDRRLQAHQEAFTLWRKLLSSVHRESVHGVIVECQEWWNKNCLYLSPEAREAFSDAYFAAHMHSSLLQARSNSHVVEENWRKITGAGNKIVGGAELPPLGEREAQVLGGSTSAPNRVLNQDAQQEPRVG